MVYRGGNNARAVDGTADDLVRPPGAPKSEAFFDSCLQCGDCGSVCPKQAIRFDTNGYPFLLTPGLCMNCGLCADICMHGAIEFTVLTRVGLRYTKMCEKSGRGA